VPGIERRRLGAAAVWAAACALAALATYGWTAAVLVHELAPDARLWLASIGPERAELLPMSGLAAIRISVVVAVVVGVAHWRSHGASVLRIALAAVLAYAGAYALILLGSAVFRYLYQLWWLPWVAVGIGVIGGAAVYIESAGLRIAAMTLGLVGMSGLLIGALGLTPAPGFKMSIGIGVHFHAAGPLVAASAGVITMATLYARLGRRLPWTSRHVEQADRADSASRVR